MSVEKLLVEEVENQAEVLNQLGYGSEEHHRGVQDMAMLVDKINDIHRIELDHQEKKESREQEKDIKLKQMKEERIERCVKYGITLVTFTVSLGFSVWAYKDSKLFEMGFTQTTEAGRASTRKVLSFLDKFK